MKRLFELLLHSLKTDGRDWTIFALSLLSAFSIWFIHNLSSEYSDFMRVQIRAESNVAGHAELSSNTCEVTARCRTSGYNIMRAWLFSRRSHNLAVKPSDLHPKTGDMFYLTKNDLNEYAHLIFGENVTVEYYLSDTLMFRFPAEASKKVPVLAVHTLRFEPQYMGIGNLTIEPDSVTVYGEPYHLKNVDRVLTETIKLENLNTSTSGVASLEKVRGIRLSEESVHYHLDVSRFVELRTEVKVETRNVPAGKEMMVYPSMATAVIKCAFPVLSDVSQTTFYVDYEDFASSISGKCLARPDYLPEGVLDYSLVPEVFECVLNEK